MSISSEFECLLLNGSQIVTRLRTITWVESEGCFYGKDEEGDAWFVWDIEENLSSSYRRAPN